MHRMSRRGVALLATVAMLGGAALTTASQAFGASASAADSTSRADRALLDPVIAAVLNLISLGVPIQTAVAGLTSDQLGAVLGAADPAQLDALLAGLDASQLTSGLGALGVVELGDLLAPLTGANLSTVLGALTFAQVNGALATLTSLELTNLLGAMSIAQIAGILGAANATQLTSVVGLLSPAQITSLLPGLSAPLVTGLTGHATSLAGGTPSASSVNALLAQVQGLLGGGLVPGTDGLLTNARSLVGVAGVDPALLTSLLAVATNALNSVLPGLGTGPLQNLITTITTILGIPTGGGGGGTGGGGASGATPARPATILSGRGIHSSRPSASQPAFTGYRATIGKVKVAKSRRSARLTVSCPANAPKGCLVTLKGTIAGRKAFSSRTIVVMRNAKKSVTTKLARSGANRLKKKGGALKVSAVTAMSSLPATTKTVKIARRR